MFLTVYFAEQCFSQVLHMCSKYSNCLDTNKPWETSYNLSWPTCNLLWKILQINTIARFALVGTSCFYGSKSHLFYKCICIHFVLC